MCGHIGHVEFGQHFFGALCVVVSRAAHQRKTSQRNHGVHADAAVLVEKRVNRGARIKPGGKGRNHAQAACFQAGDHAVVVAGVASQQIGTHEQQAHGALHGAVCGLRQGQRFFGKTPSHARVVDAHFGVMHRRVNFEAAAQAAARAVCSPVHHVAHQVEHVVVRATHPILHGQKVGPHVLCRARNKAQHLRQAAQHLHLRGAAGGGFFFAAAQLFEQRHRAAGGLEHVELAQARELGDFGGRGDADHGVALHAPRAQGFQDGQEMVFQKQHAGHHNVGLRDVGLAAGDQGVVACVF